MKRFILSTLLRVTMLALGLTLQVQGQEVSPLDKLSAGQMLSRREYHPYEMRIRAGDYAAIEELQGQDQLLWLCRVLSLAARRQIQPRELVLERTRRAIIQIPDYARRIGDWADQLTNDMDTYMDTGYCIYYLELLATPESIEQLGRFLEDPRMPRLIVSEELRKKHQDYVPGSIASSAADHMMRALGDKFPFYSRVGLSPENRVKLIAWWKSDASLPYRPSRQKAGAKVATVAAPVSSAAPVAAASTVVGDKNWEGILGGIILAAAVVLAVWIAVGGRRKGAG